LAAGEAAGGAAAEAGEEFSVRGAEMPGFVGGRFVVVVIRVLVLGGVVWYEKVWPGTGGVSGLERWTGDVEGYAFAFAVGWEAGIGVERFFGN